MDAQRRHKTNQDIHAVVPALYVLMFCLNAVYCDMFCPPAILNTGYNITFEKYNLLNNSLVNTTATWYHGDIKFTVCNLATLKCSVEYDKFSDNLFYHIIHFGNDDIQLIVGTTLFIRPLESTYTVVWEQGGIVERESCTVSIGNDRNECAPVSPCVNATSCIDKRLGYQCVCSNGYSGINCREGNLNLYCNISEYTLQFQAMPDSCIELENNCYVAGFPYNTDIGLSYSLTQNNGSNAVVVQPSTTNNSISFTVCTTYTTVGGTYLISFNIQSPFSTAPFKVEIVAYVTGISIPVFNTPVNPGTFARDIPENTRPLGTTIATVYKAKTKSCEPKDCMQVIDSNPSNKGTDSLRLFVNLVRETSTYVPPITFQDHISNDTLGKFVLSGPLKIPDLITYNLLAVNGYGGSAMATVIFNITDANEPPICNTSQVTADLDIRSQPIKYIGAVLCFDKDVIDTYKRIVYSITDKYAGYFSVSENGTIMMYAPVKGLEPGLLLFNVTVTGYSATPDNAYVINIPVLINLTAPQAICNLTVTRFPYLWAVNSEVELMLACETWGLDKLKVLSWSHSDLFTVTLTNQSSTTKTMLLNLKWFKPMSISFEVNVTLGEKVSTVVIPLPMYNGPKFKNASYSISVSDTLLENKLILNLQELVISEINGTKLTYKIKSGDKDSIFFLNNDGVLLTAKKLQQYGGSHFDLVCEICDSVSDTTDTTTVAITVVDTNEAPVCDQPKSVTINSDLMPDVVIYKLLCIDPDFRPENNQLFFTITCDTPTVQLAIKNNGDIVLVKSLPAGITSIGVQVNVSDIGLSTIVQFNIIVNVITCPQEAGQSGLLFPVTPVNSEVMINCSAVHSGKIVRSCYLNQTWGPYHYNNCSRSDLAAITDMVTKLVDNNSALSPDEVSNKIKSVADNLNTSLVNSKILLPKDIQDIAEIFSNVGEMTQKKLANLDGQTTKGFTSAADIIFGANKDTWEEARRDNEIGAKMLIALDNIVASYLRDNQPDGTTTVSTKYIELYTATSSDDITFLINSEDSLETNKLSKQSGHSVFLPKRAFGNLPVKFSVILYKNVTDKLQINPKLQTVMLSKKVLGSNVIAFTTNITITKLSQPLQINFSVEQINRSDPVCGFLNTQSSVPGVWATEGCSTTNYGGTVQCSCNHLTNFAVLMSPFGDAVSSTDRNILSIISAVGCGISLFFLLLTIIIYIILWKYVRGDRSVLHLHLSVFLILAYIVFLAGVDRTDNEIGCKIVAALLHYLFLAVFFIMLSEGIELFKSVSFVFSAESILCKLLSMSYCVPAIIVAVSLGVTRTEGYGNPTSCWLSTSGGLIWAFVGPVLLVILINFIIIIQVVRIMQKSKQMMVKSAHLRAKSVVRTICMLSPLLGITWVFGVLSVDQGTIFFQYLFAIFNSLQGLIVFICYCLINPLVRDGFRARSRKHRAKSFTSSQKTVSSSISGQFKKSRTNSGSNSDSYLPNTSVHDSSNDYRRNSGNNLEQYNDNGRKNSDHQPHPQRASVGYGIPLSYTDTGRKDSRYDNTPLSYQAVFGHK